MKVAALTAIAEAFGRLTPAEAAASNAFVLMTLGFLGFLLGAFAVAAYVLWRRETYPTPEQRLLMELQEPEKPSVAPAGQMEDEKESTSQPWERPADWWRNQG